MTHAIRTAAVLLATFLSLSGLEAQNAPVPAQAFVGTWVGTQRWAIATPPPGANPEQPVAITIVLVEGKLRGLMTPFMGGEDGVVFTEGTIAGDELHASAVFGNPTPDQVPVTEDARDQQGDFKIVPSNGRSRKQPWKDTIKVDFTFRSHGVSLKGAATVTMNEMKWLSFDYDLSKKRARY